jgi:DNA (cytosine-5)-methyltransferase 1
VTLTFGSLFAGIGGLDLGLERAGFECRWQVEINPFATQVLAKHWPNVARYGDIHDCNGGNLERVDLICGGFPCQDVSTAGLQKGLKEGTRTGLWIEYARVIGDLRPRVVLAENVAGLRSSNRGGDFAIVLRDLAALGYDAEWESVPAGALGAPHRRDRVFVIAWDALSPTDTDRLRCGGLRGDDGDSRPELAGQVLLADAGGLRRDAGRAGQSLPRPGLDGEAQVAVADADGAGLQESRGFRRAAALTWAEPPSDWRAWWAVEPNMGRVADGVPARVDRLRALGNAVVPHVGEFIGHIIHRRLTQGGPLT